MAADFKSRHRISLADAYAAALAKDRKEEIDKVDQVFKALEKEIRLRWLKG